MSKEDKEQEKQEQSSKNTDDPKSRTEEYYKTAKAPEPPKRGTEEYYKTAKPPEPNKGDKKQEYEKASVVNKPSRQEPDKAPNMPSDDVIMPDIQPMAKRLKGKSASKNKLENQTNQDTSAAKSTQPPEKGKENINLDQLLDSLDPKKDNEELIKRTQVNDTPTTQVDANKSHSKPPTQQAPEVGATKPREQEQQGGEKMRVGSAEKKTTLDKAKEVFPVLDKTELKKDATNTKLYIQGKEDNKGRSFKEDIKKIKDIPSKLKSAAKVIGSNIKEKITGKTSSNHTPRNIDQSKDQGKER